MSSKPYFSTYVQDLEQTPFDSVGFIERLAWRITDGKEDDFDAEFLKRKFEEEIGSLQASIENFQVKVQRLEDQQSAAKHRYLDSLQRLHDRNSDALDRLKNLDTTMQSISPKVVHLGDQLESVHAPRARAYDALQLMKHFNEFLADQPLSSPIFTDPDRLLESGEIILKLASISQELVRDSYHVVQQRIARKYEEIEELLAKEFERTVDRKRASLVVSIHLLKELKLADFRSGNVFEDIEYVCEKTKPLIDDIFPNPQQVMNKLILNVFYGKLQETVTAKLKEVENEPDQYLISLNDLYSKTLKLGKRLEIYQSNSDPMFIDTLINSIFAQHLQKYFNPQIEQRFIDEQCQIILNRFYDSKAHQKRQISTGGLQDLKRDIQARLMTVENFGNETLLSEEVAINILQELKNALIRCTLLCNKKDSIEMVETLFDFICTGEHVDYAIEIGLAGITLAEPKQEPSTVFFAIVQQSAAITHLLIKQFDDVIYPLIKTVKSMHLVGYVRFLLNTEQKKSDFKPEDENRAISAKTNACAKVVYYLSRMYIRIKENVDGGNLSTVLAELGSRFFTTIINHIKSFNYNLTGTMLLISDVNEYRKCVAEWKIAELGKQFEALHALVNLMVVVPENLQEASNAQALHGVDPALINAFVQLRHDATKTARFFTKS
ncbi:Exocyst complex component 5 [Aphelenchoides bicaudatus]|nr:Exocyst complex component 5 [Aphelenchoides bicaudatus]